MYVRQASATRQTTFIRSLLNVLLRGTWRDIAVIVTNRPSMLTAASALPAETRCPASYRFDAFKVERQEPAPVHTLIWGAKKGGRSRLLPLAEQITCCSKSRYCWVLRLPCSRHEYYCVPR